MGRIRVLLADNQCMVREGIATLLNGSDEIEVAGQVGCSAELINQLGRDRFDIVIMDVTLANQDASSSIEFLKRCYPATKLIVLATPHRSDYALHMMETGADGYVLKSNDISDLISSIKAVHQGRSFISQELRAEIAHRLHRPRLRRQGVDRLSQREFQMLRLLAQGSRISDCAKHMSVSQSTASTYRARIMDKLNLRTTGEIIRFAVEQGITE